MVSHGVMDLGDGRVIPIPKDESSLLVAHVGLGACQRLHFKTWEAYGNMLIHPSLFEERTDNLGIVQ